MERESPDIPFVYNVAPNIVEQIYCMVKGQRPKEMILKVRECARKRRAVGRGHEALEELPHVGPGLTLISEPVVQLGYVLGADEEKQELKGLSMWSNPGQVLRQGNEPLRLMHHDLRGVLRRSQGFALSDPRFRCRSAIEVGREEIDPGLHVCAKPNY